MLLIFLLRMKFFFFQILQDMTAKHMALGKAAHTRWKQTLHLFTVKHALPDWTCISEDKGGHFQCIKAPDHFLLQTQELELKTNSTARTRHKSNYSLNTFNDFPPFSACAWNAGEPVHPHDPWHTGCMAIPFPVSAAPTPLNLYMTYYLLQEPSTNG